jgi:hypothetical protein
MQHRHMYHMHTCVVLCCATSYTPAVLCCVLCAVAVSAGDLQRASRAGVSRLHCHSSASWQLLRVFSYAD